MKIIFSLFFLFSAVVFAEPLWITESRKAIKILPRDLYIYHWTKAARLGIKAGEKVDPVDPRLFEYIKMRTSSFWTYSDSSSILGEGLYYATDPYASRGHGSTTEWALIRTILPKGTRYFDLYFTTAWDYTYSDRAIEELKQSGCTVAKGVRAILESYGCLEARREMYRVLNVSLATYWWGSDSIPGCRARTKHAFFFVSPELFNEKNTILLTEKTDDMTARRDQGYIQSYYSFQKEFLPPWKLSKFTSVSADEFYNWIQTYISGCGNYSEF